MIIYQYKLFRSLSCFFEHSVRLLLFILLLFLILYWLSFLPLSYQVCDLGQFIFATTQGFLKLLNYTRYLFSNFI